MNFYALNETPINGHATRLGTAAASLVLSGVAHGVKAVTASASALIALSATSKAMVYWHPRAASGVVVSASASSTIAISGRAAGNIAITASARPMVRAHAQASGQVEIAAGAIAMIIHKPTAAMSVAVNMTAAGRIAAIRFGSAKMKIDISAKAANKVARTVFASAKFEPITLDATARGKLIMTGRAAGVVRLQSAAASKGYTRVFSGARGRISFHARASSAVWRQQYSSAAAVIQIVMRYGGGTRPIPSVYEPSPYDRAMKVSADHRTFIIPADERAL